VLSLLSVVHGARRPGLVLAGLGVATLAGAVLVGPAAASPGSRPARPAGLGATVEHWGAFIDLYRVANMRRSPVRLRLPGRVAGIGTSNSTDYELLANGSVYAWGRASTASWATAGRATRSPGRSGSASRPV
jgi:hypothetical protein